MDTLNYDITNIIFKQIPAIDQLQLSKVFNEPRPSQFHVSSELMASKDLCGYKGLIMRAIITSNEFLYYRIYNMIEEQLKIGNYEPCVQLLVQIQKQFYYDPWNTREDDARKDFKNFLRELLNLMCSAYENMDDFEWCYDLIVNMSRMLKTYNAAVRLKWLKNNNN